SDFQISPAYSHRHPDRITGLDGCETGFYFIIPFFTEALDVLVARLVTGIGCESGDSLCITRE
ncbi:MAG: hypothetical protein WBN06_12715, partial [Lysobacterales bacterium]